MISSSAAVVNHMYKETDICIPATSNNNYEPISISNEVERIFMPVAQHVCDVPSGAGSYSGSASLLE
jgi:hypothetical protein